MPFPKKGENIRFEGSASGGNFYVSKKKAGRSTLGANLRKSRKEKLAEMNQGEGLRANRKKNVKSQGHFRAQATRMQKKWEGGPTACLGWRASPTPGGRSQHWRTDETEKKVFEGLSGTGDGGGRKRK